jgi:hypothetical protein
VSALVTGAWAKNVEGRLGLPRAAFVAPIALKGLA